MNHDIETESYRKQKELEWQRQIENQNKQQEIDTNALIFTCIVGFILFLIMFC